MSKSFEENIKEIEAIVNKLETEEIPLEKSIELYKKGLVLLKESEDKIDKVEKEIEIVKDKLDK